MKDIIKTLGQYDIAMQICVPKNLYGAEVHIELKRYDKYRLYTISWRDFQSTNSNEYIRICVDDFIEKVIKPTRLDLMRECAEEIGV